MKLRMINSIAFGYNAAQCTVLSIFLKNSEPKVNEKLAPCKPGSRISGVLLYVNRELILVQNFSKKSDKIRHCASSLFESKD